MNESSDPHNCAEPSTHAQLVTIARALFAHAGYEGTSIRAITTAANANLGAVTYHFGSKRGLYEAVLESCVQPLRERIYAALSTDAAPLDRIEAVVREYFAYMSANPEVVMLLMQEMVTGGETPEVAIKTIRGVHAALTQVVSEGQQRGEIRQGEAAVMAVSIVSQPMHIMIMRRPLAAFTGLDIEQPEILDRFVMNAIAFVRGGLSVRT